MMAKKKAEQAGFPKTLYIEDTGVILEAYRTAGVVPRSVDPDENSVTVGVYELAYVAQVTTEIKVTQCGPSKAGR